MSRTLQLVVLLVFTYLMSACGGGGGGGSTAVGSSGSSKLVANPEALGLGTTSRHTNSAPSYVVRANSVVTLTGKDSDSPYPILGFEWQQLDNGAPDVILFERTQNSVAFISPNVDEVTVLAFVLAVEDSEGEKASRTVEIEVLPAADANRFLIDPAAPAQKLKLVAALEGGAETGAQTHQADIEVRFIAHWLDRLGEPQSKLIQQSTKSIEFPAGFSPEEDYNPLVRAENPRVSFDLVALDLDLINKDFESASQRNKRLDPWRIGDARIDIEIILRPSTALEFELHVLSPSNELIPKSTLGASETVAATSIDGYLLRTASGELDATIQQDNLLAAMGLESNISARNYYALIDPEGRFATLSAWLEYAGFPALKENVDNYPDIAHAVYLNNYDLGFGRDMYLRKDDDGNVYSYVINYPSVEAALNKTGEFAVVVMEYSDNPDPNGENEKIVKFYSYVPDTLNGGYVRTTTMNFDGRGEKAVPGVCTACHQSNPVPRQFTHVSEADVDATFMPWDVDSFLYAAANDPRYVEKTIDAAKYKNSPISPEKYSRENMLEPLRQLNLGALATYTDNPERHSDSIALIHGWYGDENLALPVDQLPENDFNGDYTQPGWASQSDLYHQVFARNCRLCHVQINNDDTDFDSYAEFIGNERLINYVFETGTMPMARLTMDRFWAPFHAGEASAATQLREHLLALGETVSERPGLPLARFASSPSVVTIDDLVTLDATNSLFAEQYNWQMNTPAGSDAVLANTDKVQNSFQPDVPGGEYQLSLTITSDSGQTADVSQVVAVVDRAPVAECFEADTNGLTASGLLSGIPVLANIANAGDGALGIIDLEPGEFGSATLSEDGEHVHYQLNDPFNRGEDVIRYRLEDLNGTLSSSGNSCPGNDGYGQIYIDSRRGELAPTEVNATPAEDYASSMIQIAWVAPEQVTVDAYRIYRQGVEGFIAETGNTNYTDTGLEYDTEYNYYITSVIGGSESQPSASATASTAELVPTTITTAASSPSTVELAWQAPDTQVDVYRVYNVDDQGNPDLLATTDAPLYTATGLTGGTPYTFGVSAEDNTQESAINTAAPVTTYPEMPASLNANLGADARSQISLSWQAPPSGLWDGYELQRKTAGGVYSTLAQPLADAAQYLDSGLSASTEYSYRLAATADGLLSEFATEVTLNTLANEAAKPTALNAVPHPVNNATQISLSWALPAGFSPSELRLERDDNADGSVDSTTILDASQSSYVDDVMPATDYSYVIAAYYESTSALEASEAAVAATASLQPGDILTESQTQTSIALSWAAPEATVSGYQIMRDGNEIIASHPDTSYTDNDVQPGIAYLYEVRALQNGQSAATSATIATVPAPVTDLIVENVGGVNNSSSLALQWTYQNDPDAWVLQRRKQNDAVFTTITAPEANARSFVDVGLDSETTYIYRLSALSNSLESEPVDSSAIATAAVGEEAPQDLTINSDSIHDATQLNLNWTMNGGYTPSSYKLLRNDVVIAQDLSTTSYSDNNGGTWLEPGTTYEYRVIAVYSDGEASSASVLGTTDSLAVQNLSATQTTTTIELEWSAPLANTSEYQVRRGSLPAVSQTATVFSATGLSPGTAYDFEVSAWQNGKSQVVTASFATQPVAPTGLSVSTINGSGSSSSLQLNWSWQGDDPDSWLLERSSDSGLSYVAVTVPESSARSLLDSGLNPETSYTYRLAAITNGVSSEAANSVELATKAIDAEKPQNFAVAIDDNNDATQINLSWDMNEGFAPNSYQIYQVVAGGDDVLLAELTDASLRTFAHEGLEPDTLYSYRMLARYDDGDAEAGIVASAATRSLQVQSMQLDSQTLTSIAFSWNAPAAKVSSYQLLRDGVEVVASQQGSSFADSGLQAGTLYQYEVRAYQNGESQSVVANYATVPLTPTINTAINGENRSTEIDITWSYTGNGEPEWLIQRKAPGEADFSLLTTIPAAESAAERVTNYKDSGLTPGSVYSYRLIARLHSTNSAASESSETTAPIAPSLAAQLGSNETSDIALNWSYSGAGAPIWKLERALFGSNSYITVTTLPANQFSFTDSVSPGYYYSYRVSGVLNGVASDPSALASESTRPIAPTGVNAIKTSTAPTSAIDISWAQVSCSGSIDYRVNGTLSDTPTTKRFTLLNHDTVYSFTVTATCNGKQSANSSAASARTDVSYSKLFDDSLDGSSNCLNSGCHLGQTKASFYTKISGSSCIKTWLNGGTCSSMNQTSIYQVLNFTEEQRFIRWLDQGKKNN